MNSTEVYSSVSNHYGAAAKANASSSNGYSQKVANAFGYSSEDLEGMPEEANLGLSCGNPIALANLREGETVLDLGCGAGFDVFQAAKKVGSTGRAIGVDFNKDMLARANSIKSRMSNNSNISFVNSTITSVNLESGTADCIISNCVINLVPEDEKQLVFNEMFRLLKSGGRVAVSDILAKGEMPKAIKEDMSLYVGCIAGASEVEAYREYFEKAGFKDVLMVDAKSDLNVYWQTEGAENGAGVNACCGPSSDAPSKEEKKSSCCRPSSKNEKGSGPMQNGKHVDFNEYAGSYKIFAIKP